MRGGIRLASARADEDAKDNAVSGDGGKLRGKEVKGSDGADTLKGGRGDDRIFGFDGKGKAGDIGAIHAELMGSGFGGAVFASSAPGDPDRLYVLRKDVGEIHILNPASGQSSLFLNIPDSQFTSGGEEGVLGLAFHPDYAGNGRFFVHMVNAAGDLEIREYARSGNPNLANPAPVKTVLTIPHPDHGNHNGGTVVFGPNDGYLYVTCGDGGGGDDPDENGQNKNVLLGKILRLDIDGDDFADPGRNYAIPNDNPFVGKAGADEVWAYGLRNPWRIAFDENGDLYIGDVGQSAREEIDFQPAASNGGENYGWDLAEGSLGNPPAGSVLPVFEYGRNLGTVVTGGEVYRGDGPALNGAYFFADFGSGRLWTLKNGVATERTSQLTGPEVNFVSSFGRDGDGNLYAVNLGGDIFLLTMKEHAGDLGDTLRGRGGDDKIYGGSGDDLIRGDGGDDRLSGGVGDDLIRGGKGRDKLLGDDGADTFRFDVAPKPKNLDTIAGFVPGEDTISLRKPTFGAIGNTLGNAEFHVGKGATTAAHRIVYSPDNGAVIYDRNGSDDGGATRFLKLAKGLDLDNGDFVLA